MKDRRIRFHFSAARTFRRHAPPVLAAIAVVLFAGGPVGGAEITGFSHSDGARTLWLTLVTDEVAVRREDREVELRRNQIPTTAAGLRLFLAQIVANEGREAMPVFYVPTEAQPDRRPAWARRVLPSRLSVSLLGDADPAALAAKKNGTGAQFPCHISGGAQYIVESRDTRPIWYLPAEPPDWAARR